MRLKDQFRFVRQNMKKNRTRVFMTILATAMGCSFLIVLASVAFGLQKSVVKDMTERRIVTQIDVQGKMDDQGGSSFLTDKDIKILEKFKDVKAVTRRKMLQQETTFTIGNYQEGSQTYVANFPSEVKAGFELSKGRLPAAKEEVVVGYNFPLNLVSKDAKDEIYDKNGLVKEEYRFKESLIGKKIELIIRQNQNGKVIEKPFTFTVAGIGKKPTKEWAQDFNVFISEGALKEIEAFTGTPKGMLQNPNNLESTENNEAAKNSFDEVKIFAENVEAVKAITEKLKEKKYVNYSIVNELKEINLVFTIAKVGLIFIGTIAILIASIGIYNTMTMAVTERAPDIGIMKAIGANPKTIRRIFLLESSYIGLIGAIIGTLVSYGISYAVNFAIPLIIKQAFGENAPRNFSFSEIPIILPIICIAICYGVTILSGLRPANRATKVDVLRAMRREV